MDALAVLDERGCGHRRGRSDHRGPARGRLPGLAGALHTILGELDFNRFLGEGLEGKLLPGRSEGPQRRTTREGRRAAEHFFDQVFD